MGTFVKRYPLLLAMLLASTIAPIAHATTYDCPVGNTSVSLVAQLDGSAASTITVGPLTFHLNSSGPDAFTQADTYTDQTPTEFIRITQAAAFLSIQVIPLPVPSEALQNPFAAIQWLHSHSTWFSCVQAGFVVTHSPTTLSEVR